MAKPLASVVIVCHNDWPHLELAIESALCQSHQPIEVIVVDNDSSDDTEREIRSRFMDRVRYIKQANVGAAGGRNTGFAAAQGKYIQMLDGDDVLAPNKIAIHVEHLEQHPEIDIAYGDFRTFRSTPDVPADSLFDIDTGDYPDMKQLLLGRCPGPPIIFMFRKSVVDRVGLQAEDVYYEDYEYWIRCAFAGCQFARTPGAWAFYRRRFGQKSEKMIRAALAELDVLRRVRTYVNEEPYKKQLAEKVSRLEYAFAHYYLWSGDLANAQKFLRAALESAPPHLRFAQSKVVGWLSRISFGPTLYGVFRRMRRLPPPFSTTFGGTKTAAA